MSGNELKKALYIIANYIMELESETFPLSKDHDWIESATIVIARIIQKISDDEEVTGDD